MQNTIKPCLVALLSLVSVVGWSPRSHVDCIVFDEVQSLNVWLTVSSLANKDPNNKSNILFRQIELNWINAPLNDDGDYLALYLDTEPDAPGGATPVSVHHPSGISGKLLVPDHYFPVIDFYNETFQQHKPTTTAAADNQLWPTDNNNSNHLNRSSIEREASPPTPQAPSSSRFGAAQYESERRTVLVPNGDRWNTYYLRFSRPDVGLAEIAREVPPGSVFEIGRTARRQDQGPEPSSLNVRADSTQKSRLVEECVGYCVAYHSQRKILAKSCLRTRPNWMQESQIGSRSLTTIAIAGTHNSGTYLKQRPNTHKIDKSVLQLINKYQLNQEENVFNQLMYGIRYLDLRIGFTKVKHRPEELWVYHDIFRTDNSLNEILKQIKRFLELARGEIVIIDFHRFTVGFQNEDPETELERHGKVLELLFKTLGEYIVPSYLGQNGPLNEYIGLNKRLFVGYAGRSRLLSLQSAAASDDHSIQLGASGQQLVAQQQQVRDIDADKQDEENGSNNQTVTRAMSAAATTTGAQPKRAHSGSSPYNLDDDDDENRQQEMLDRRLGTRVYNRLKSLKLISHSFSKRSIELHSNNNNTNKSNHSEYNSRIVKHSRAKIVGNIYKVRERIIQPQPLATERSMRVVHTTSESLLSSSSLPVSFNSRLSLLFNPVHHVWPNTDKEETLRQFIEQSACRKYFGELNSLMAELTPTVFGAISDKYDGIRRLSSLTNRMVGDLIRSKFLHCINLIATDYFLGNDLIRLTIYANKLRQQQQHTRNTDLEPLQGKCKSFRHIRPILEKYKHTTAAMDNTNSILSSSAAAGATPSSSSSSGPYQSESGGVGISDIITSLFKRLFN